MKLDEGESSRRSPTVCSVIAGATSRAEVEANVAAGGWLPCAEDLEELDRLTLSGWTP